MTEHATNRAPSFDPLWSEHARTATRPDYHGELCAALGLEQDADPETVIRHCAALTAEIQVLREKRDRCAKAARSWRDAWRESARERYGVDCLP